MTPRPESNTKPAAIAENDHGGVGRNELPAGFGSLNLLEARSLFNMTVTSGQSVVDKCFGSPKLCEWLDNPPQPVGRLSDQEMNARIDALIESIKHPKEKPRGLY